MSQSVNLQELFAAYEKEDAIEVLPAGSYVLEVLRATVRNGNKGQGILPVFKVVEGPYAGKTVMAGQFTASEAGRSIFFRQLSGFGLDESFFQQGNDINATAKALVGRVVQAQIQQRDYQGAPRNNLAIGGIKLIRQAADPVAAGLPQQGVAQTPAPVQSTPPAATTAPAPAVAPAPAQPPETAAPAAPATAAVPPMPPLPPMPGSGPGF